ncbi:hypothetical protein AB1Y20_016357 [Prymnesium parvum]|uniref:JmjC domain-containing protein n=1 Tax=Prymnesium parvum TaxID=97485 RepID=A0AB34ID28_PRYPA
MGLLERVRRVRRLAGLLGLLAGGLAAIVATLEPAALLWSAAQLLHSLSPSPLAWASEWQDVAWAHWLSRAPSAPRDPSPLPVLRPGERPASLATPFVVRGLLNGSRAMERFGGTAWLREPPLRDLLVDYHEDAAAEHAVTPRGRGRLGEVVERILGGGREKLGTQKVFATFPELLPELGARALLAPLFGESHFRKSWMGRTLTVPLFVGRGSEDGAVVRTDLHCEPIGNVVLMLTGGKRWTLVAPNQSYALKPTVSPDGRAYFLSMLPNVPPPGVFASHVERYEVETFAGDVLWVPTWTWHRVEYLPGVTAVSVSLFHVRSEQIWTLNPLFATLLAPNFLKELLGWKTQ